MGERRGREKERERDRAIKSNTKRRMHAFVHALRKGRRERQSRA